MSKNGISYTREDYLKCRNFADAGYNAGLRMIECVSGVSV
jgi:hypothetical protein